MPHKNYVISSFDLSFGNLNGPGKYSYEDDIETYRKFLELGHISDTRIGQEWKLFKNTVCK